MNKRPRLIVNNGNQSPWRQHLEKRRKPRRPWYLRRAWLQATLAVVAAIVIFSYYTGDFDNAPQTAVSFTNQMIGRQQLYVIDGDTIHYNGERIRIANIDTPEITQAKCDSELKRGLEAKAFLKELIDGRPLIINRGDPHTGRMTDQYGRTLALVSTGGRDVGTILVQRRLARPWTGRRMPWC
ncbi:MAG: thermonuclease family protein [Phyllobacterium sp.]|uniref:thermonuclease family protein n=1 Tax=Phyllobacterium sp. TaxID=1871046 RepID=UPI0030F27460